MSPQFQNPCFLLGTKGDLGSITRVGSIFFHIILKISFQEEDAGK
jgi:hypothetical protein|tara:strand:- start:1 stop:135 length:135 start_codon:yes stop_codon:yes gene_type:complete